MMNGLQFGRLEKSHAYYLDTPQAMANIKRSKDEIPVDVAMLAEADLPKYDTYVSARGRQYKVTTAKKNDSQGNARGVICIEEQGPKGKPVSSRKGTPGETWLMSQLLSELNRFMHLGDNLGME